MRITKFASTNLLLALVLFWAGCPPVLAVVKPQAKPWIRLQGEAYNLRLSPNGKGAAFTDRRGFNLSYLDLASKKIYRISRMKTGGSFFFSPDGYRIFFRELTKTPTLPVVSTIKAFDCHSKQQALVAEIKDSSGYLTFDPRDLRFQLLHPAGIMSKVIVLPDQRLAKWQMAQNTGAGKWLASPQGMLWLSHEGFAMNQLADDQSGLQSFDISPDGTYAAWATIAGRVYLSHLGQKPRQIARGFDPKWHPINEVLVLAGARMTGTKIVSTDIRTIDKDGNGKWLTFAGGTDERWPSWSADGKMIVYALAGTTDIYRIKVTE